MTDAVLPTPTATSPDKPPRARKPRPAKGKPAPTVPPKPKPARAPVVRVVTAYLASLSEHHAAAADVLGAEFKRALRDELALDAKVRALISRRESLEHDLQQVGEAINGCFPSKACRARLDKFAAHVAEAKGAVPAVEDVTDADLRGVEVP